MTILTEVDVESAALEWLAAIGWQVAHGPWTAPDITGAERNDCRRVTLDRRCAKTWPC